ncbi:tetratricopeptide repeat protein [bacterium]|nr:tetratricopeptide repeat protein [bacterium]
MSPSRVTEAPPNSLWQTKLDLRQMPWLPPIIILIVGCIAYANSFDGTFVYDDTWEIGHNHHLRPPNSIFSAAFGGLRLPARPIPYMSFAVDYRIWGGQPWGFHWTNLLIHLINGLLIFAIVRRLIASELCAESLRDRAVEIAMFAAVLWIAHPINTNAVTYIYQRLESLMSLFFLTSLFCYVRSWNSSRAVWWLGGAIVAACFSMLSKESGVAILPVLFFLDVAREQRSFIRSIRTRWLFWGFLLLTIVPMAIAISVEAGSYPENALARTPLEHLLSFPRCGLAYLHQVFWPTSLCFDYAWTASDDPTQQVLSAAILVAIAALTIRLYIKQPLLGWGVASIFLILGPTSSIFPTSQLASEHRMYLPSAFLSSIMTIGAYRVWMFLWNSNSESFNVLRLGFIGLSILLVLLTRARNEDYYSMERLWSSVIASNPENANGYINVASDLYTKGEYQAALQTLHEGLTKNETAFALLLYSECCLKLGHREMALEAIEASLRLKPNRPEGYVTYGTIVASDSPDLAVAAYRHALELDPHHAGAANKLGTHYFNLQQWQEAVNWFKRAVANSPDDESYRRNLQTAKAELQRSKS